MRPKTLLAILTTISLFAMTGAFSRSQISYATSMAATSVPNVSLPQNLGATLNTDTNDTAPFVAPNGLSLYFSRLDAGFGSLDIWVSTRPTLTSAWGPAENLGAVINTESNENQPALSSDGLRMLFNSSKPGGFGMADIYLSTRIDVNDNFGWTMPVNLGPAINTAFNEVGAEYFENPSAKRGTFTLYFASDRTANIDIYQSERDQNGTFSTPVNVTPLNSAANEEGPSISRNGLEMLFSSTREGVGARDIWVSTRTSVSGQWDPPANVTRLNSDLDDANVSRSPDDGLLYFGSACDGGSGQNDIYTAYRLCNGGN